MKSILRAIRNMLRAMRKAASGLVRTTVVIGGKLVSVLVPGPAMAPELDFENAYEVPTVSDEMKKLLEPQYYSEEAVRRAAGQMIGGGKPDFEVMAELQPMQTEWLACMPDEMLRKVAFASLPALREHMDDTKAIRGVLRYDGAAIDAYVEALIRAEDEEEARLEMQNGPNWAMA